MLLLKAGTAAYGSAGAFAQLASSRPVSSSTNSNRHEKSASDVMFKLYVLESVSFCSRLEHADNVRRIMYKRKLSFFMFWF